MKINFLDVEGTNLPAGYPGPRWSWEIITLPQIHNQWVSRTPYANSMGRHVSHSHPNGTGGAHIRTGQKTFFFHKWTGQKILDGLIGRALQKQNKKDKTGRATHISGPSLYAPAPVIQILVTVVWWQNIFFENFGTIKRLTAVILWPQFINVPNCWAKTQKNAGLMSYTV